MLSKPRDVKNSNPTSQSNLKGANFKDAILDRANLVGQDLRETVLTGASMAGTALTSNGGIVQNPGDGLLSGSGSGSGCGPSAISNAARLARFGSQSGR